MQKCNATISAMQGYSILQGLEICKFIRWNCATLGLVFSFRSRQVGALPFELQKKVLSAPAVRNAGGVRDALLCMRVKMKDIAENLDGNDSQE